MSIRRKGLVAAMEDEGSVGIELGEGVDAGAADAMQADQAVQDTHDEIEEVQAAIEDAEEGAEDLEAIGDVAADTIEDGGEGMSEDAARVTEVAVESICRRLGVRGSSIVPAIESFGSRSSRITATRITVEGIVDGVQKIWAAIIAAFKKVWAKLKDFYKYLTDSNVRMEARAKALLEKVNKAGSTIETDKFENQSIANAFHDKGDFSVKRLKDALANIKGELKFAKKAAEDAADEADKVAKYKDIAQIKAASEKLTAAKLSSTSHNAEVIKGLGLTAEQSASVSTSLEMLSGSFVVLYYDKVSADDDTAEIIVPVIAKQEFSDEDEEVKAEVETATKSEAQQICQAVIQLCAEVKTTQNVTKAFDKMDKALNDALKSSKAAQTAAAGDNKELTSMFKKVQAARVKMMRSLGDTVRIYSSFPQKEASKGGNLALNYVATSIGNWKSGK
jgi:hypothetical protein